jgi:hypothetical protein
MSTEKPRSPLDTAAMRICRLANTQNQAAMVDFDRYWDLALSMKAREVYRRVAREVAADLAQEDILAEAQSEQRQAATDTGWEPF